MTNLLAGSTSPTPQLSLHLLRHPTDRQHCRTCYTATSDSRAPRMMSACHTPPAQDQGTAAKASEDASNTQDDIVYQQSTGDLDRHRMFRGRLGSVDRPGCVNTVESFTASIITLRVKTYHIHRSTETSILDRLIWLCLVNYYYNSFPT